MPTLPRVLVVEDDEAARSAMAEILSDERFDPVPVGSLREAETALGGESPPSGLLVDVTLPDGSGLDLLETVRAAAPAAEVVVITGDERVETVVDALRRGASDYLTKPVDVARLSAILRDLRRRLAGSTEVEQALEEAAATGRFHRLVGRSPGLLAVYRQIQRVAPTEATVLVQGETGTGKEMVAQTVHDLSPRSQAGPLVALNCGAVSGTLIESELFGHEKGSFTGATKRHLGVFERAHGGTLFLDEITEMPLDLQVKLLRVLETRSFMRVGGENVVKSDARLVAATNRDPEKAIRDGQLREDLFYRLRVFPIMLPSLSERKGDVELLARRFLAALNEENGVEKSLGDDAVEWLEAQEWPGNVRELKNLMTRAWIMADQEIGVDALRDPALEGPAPAASGGGAREIRIPVGSTIAEAEKKLILATLEKYGGNKNTAARVLGISVNTLYSRLNVYAAAEQAS
ncbi:MAG: sigma-54-dependent transcriptional regulator [Planctomycetota bacterium JB042]